LLRSALLDCLIAAQAPTPFAAAGAALGWPPARTAAAAAGIVAQKLVVLDAEGAVVLAYPVSTSPTGHRVTLADGRTFYAMCAIDALGCHAEFGQAVHIGGSCQACGEPIQMTVGAPGEDAAGAFSAEPPTAYAVHVDLAKYEDWATKT
jgi:hypothetical protein